MKTNTTVVGMNFIGWLTILFVGLKLTGYIEWSWWWVFSPMWLPPVVVLVTSFLLWLIAKFLLFCIEAYENKYENK